MIYDLYLLPNGRLDEFLSISGVSIASKILSFAGFAVESDGRIIGCMKCNHAPQNHDEKFRESARLNEEQSQKRDADFG